MHQPHIHGIAWIGEGYSNGEQRRVIILKFCMSLNIRKRAHSNALVFFQDPAQLSPDENWQLSFDQRN